MIILFVIISFFTLVLLLHHKRKISNCQNLPPSPPSLPIIGNLHQIGSLLHHSLASLSKQYGPLLHLSLGAIPAVVIFSAEIVEETIANHDLAVSSRPQTCINKVILYGPRDIAFAPYGHHWREMRKFCVIHLLNLKKVQSFRSVREEELFAFLSNIRSASSTPVPLSQMIITLTNDIICRVTLGKKFSRYEGFEKMQKDALKLLGTVPVRDCVSWLSWIDEITGLNARLDRTFKQFDAFLEQVLDDCITQGIEKFDDGEDDDVDRKSANLIDVLLSAVKDTSDSNINTFIERDSIKGFIWDMFVAGTDTTSSTIEWAMANLLANSTLMRKAQEEIRRVLGSKPMVIDEDVDKLEYLNAIIKETLRLHPPVPINIREAHQDFILQGYNVPARTRLFYNTWMIARDPKYWSMPDTFLPERFLEKNVHYKGKDFQFLPFGAGRRICPGMAFGTLTVQLVLANLLHSFDWDIPNERKTEVLDMSELPSLTVRKKFGLFLYCKPLYS